MRLVRGAILAVCHHPMASRNDLLSLTKLLSKQFGSKVSFFMFSFSWSCVENFTIRCCSCAPHNNPAKCP